MPSEEYIKAWKQGKRDVAARRAKGEYPYLKVLDDIPEAADSLMEYPLGLVQIPTDLIVGTKTAGRSQAFAGNFMPILPEESEFGLKWAALCESHLEEGIREPIKAYEYMNRFYVLEGNKRVSVLKFFGAVSVPGYVTRIVPKRTEEKENKIYYEFMDFYNLSEVNYLWFSEEGKFAKLQRLIGKRPDEVWTDDDKMNFSAAYFRFQSAYTAAGGDKLTMTVGDAFLDFINLYGYKVVEEMTTAELKEKVTKNEKIFGAIAAEDSMEIRMNPDEDAKKTLLMRLVPLSAPKLRIAFVHETSPEESGWTYAHELGRMHLEQTFQDQIETTAYQLTNRQGGEAVIEAAIEDGNTIIFTTSPVLYKASLKVAVEHPNVRILNCSLMANHGMIRTYSARMYEAKFLMGAIAGAMAENNKIGFIADYPIYGTVANINAFTLGACMVNPRAQVYVQWASQKNIDIEEEFRKIGVSYVSGRDIIIPDKSLGSRHFGVYRMDDQTAHNLAMPLWHWGKFYERIIRNLQSADWKSDSSKSVNYWLGMSSGVADVIVSQNLPVGTARLVSLLRETICRGEFNPFSGALFSQNGLVQEENRTLTPENIITMDWLLDRVVGTIPKMEELEDHAIPVVLQQGIEPVEG
ncbi:MAG: BMP family ABC transporter substrate-binding protein [Eubacteriales bacterium]|nr:BMP family ABC transporter substrate-binding protein [Eubacteriales bacterium]